MERVAALQELFIARLEREALRISQKEPVNLYIPVKYILDIGGKRLRPAMVLLANELYGGNQEDALKAALSVEIFHNFTLLHDDIMDNAAIRRGKPTVHEKYDANTAILSGDAMSIHAYEYLLQCKSKNIMSIIKLFTRTAIEVCEGQQYDMDFETRIDVTADEYLEMIRLKTAVLLACCFKTGALVADASTKDADLMYDFGINLGLAFQLQDDYLDTYGDQTVFGKRIGGDILCNKKTYLLIHALKNSSDKLREELLFWINRTEFDDDEKITAVKTIYDEIGVATTNQRAINNYYDKALACLQKLDLAEEKKATLYKLAESILLRNK
ncbi:MAG: polyprenyl synthetase family protein [Mangrovibacterium sp.]